jgi:nucleotide-binding universal stress UspA family protein
MVGSKNLTTAVGIRVIAVTEARDIAHGTGVNTVSNLSRNGRCTVNLLEEKLNPIVSLKNILFATDFSDVSEAVLPYVAAMSLRYGGTVHVAHVLPAASVIRPSAIDPVTIGAIYEDAHSDAQAKMQRLSVRLQGFPHRTYIRHGAVTEILSEIICEHEVDLLVEGTHGRTAIGRLLMGSVAEQVFRTVTCPVLTVRPKIPRAPGVLKRGRNEDIEPTGVEFRQVFMQPISLRNLWRLRHTHFDWRGSLAQG